MASANPNPSTDPDAAGWLASLHRADASLYSSIAASSTPSHDDWLARVSDAANHSKPWIVASAGLALFGGRRGRRAALYGIASIATSATVVNVAMKPLTRRRRPDRVAAGVIEARHVSMPTSTSFPSGHSASAFAFATGVSHVIPSAGALLTIPAALVAYSRVHTGVHYPGDVLVGSLTGIALAKLTCVALDRRFC
jgi:undecaprenyl-diphosphatase